MLAEQAGNVQVDAVAHWAYDEAVESRFDRISQMPSWLVTVGSLLLIILTGGVFLGVLVCVLGMAFIYGAATNLGWVHPRFGSELARYRRLPPMEEGNVLSAWIGLVIGLFPTIIGGVLAIQFCLMWADELT
jgi:hypothetical protein